MMLAWRLSSTPVLPHGVHDDGNDQDHFMIVELSGRILPRASCQTITCRVLSEANVDPAGRSQYEGRRRMARISLSHHVLLSPLEARSSQMSRPTVAIVMICRPA